MKVIWKYPIRITDFNSIEVPKGAEFLSAKVQNGQLTVWALVTPTAPKVNRTIRIFGTGNPTDNDFETLTFIDTVLTHNDSLVWHVFSENE